MEAPEVPTEHLHEEMHHQAEHSGERWTLGVALSSAIIAGLAAIASLLAGVKANEMMVDQMKASDQWNYYQAKGVKSAVLSSKIEMLKALGKPEEPKDKGKVEQYKSDQAKIFTNGKALEASSRENLEIHECMARSVTMFQVAIAVAAISVLTKRRGFWFAGLAASLVGLAFLSQGAIKIHQHQEVEIEESETGDKAGGGEKAGKAEKAEKPGAAEKAAAGEKTTESPAPVGEKP
jgi:Domain of unknown function (DUF4337)